MSTIKKQETVLLMHFPERKLKNKGAGAKWTTLTLLKSMLITE